MKLLLDEGLPRAAAARLTELGIVATHVDLLGYAGSKDEFVLELARTNDAVLITRDADFHRLMAEASARRPSIIRLRIEAMHYERLASLLYEVVTSLQRELEAGALVSVTLYSVRTRMLPLET